MPQKQRPPKLDQVAPPGIPSPPIDYSTKRPVTDVVWYAFYLAGFVAFFAIGGTIRANTRGRPFDVSDSLRSMTRLTTVGDGAVDEYAKCMLDSFGVTVDTSVGRHRQLLKYGLHTPGHFDGEEAGHRHLSAAEHETYEHRRRLEATVERSWGIWDLLGDKPEVPVTMILLMVALSVGWMAALQVPAFSKAIVYLTLGMQIVCFWYFGSICADGGAGTMGAIFFVLGLLVLFWVLKNPAKIAMAAAMIAQASRALRENPSLFASCLVIYAPYLGYVALWLLFLADLPLCWEFRPFKTEVAADVNGARVTVALQGCEMAGMRFVSPAKDFMLFHFAWVTGMLEQVRLMMVAGVVGTWYFDKTENVPALPTLFWLRHALTTSGGTLAIGASIAALCEWIKRKASKACWCLDPIAVLLRVVLLFAEAIIVAITRMCTVVHVFTGASFCESKVKTMALLKRNFVGGVTTEVVGKMVFFLGGFVFSAAISLSAWAWYEAEYAGANLLTGGGGSWEIYLWMFGIFFGVWNPILTVFIIGLFLADNVKGCIGSCATGVPVAIPLAAIFIGSVAHMCFQYIGGIIMDATSTVMISYAIDRENGGGGNDNGELKALLENSENVYAVGNPLVAPAQVKIQNGGKKHVV